MCRPLNDARFGGDGLLIQVWGRTPDKKTSTSRFESDRRPLFTDRKEAMMRDRRRETEGVVPAGIAFIIVALVFLAACGFLATYGEQIVRFIDG